MMRWLAALSLVMMGCQSKPTKVGETYHRDLEQVVVKSQKPVQLTENTVVLDVRPAFEFGLNKIQNSQNFPWQTLAENAQSGELLRDSRQAALRLSLKGVKPETPVVIVGNGRAGQGEEGRLAWNLLLLGLHDVQVCTIETFRKNMTPLESPPALNEKPWTVNERAKLSITRPEFLKLARDPKGRLESRTYVIDARSEKEFLGEGQKDLNAINIEWKHFYTPQGRPDPEIVKRLKDLGIGPNDKIILVSSRGVRSAAAAYALLALGFSRVQNFAAGLNSIR